MKIVNRQEFLKLPAKTLYRKYSPSYFGEPEVKESGSDEYWGNDFLSSNFGSWLQGIDSSDDLFDFFLKAENDGTEFRFDLECTSRDGLYEDDQLFAIYDKEDIKQLIERLQGLL